MRTSGNGFISKREPHIIPLFQRFHKRRNRRKVVVTQLLFGEGHIQIDGKSVILLSKGRFGSEQITLIVL